MSFSTMWFDTAESISKKSASVMVSIAILSTPHARDGHAIDQKQYSRLGLPQLYGAKLQTL